MHIDSYTDSKLSYIDKTYTGWWYTYPSEKYESQLGSLFPYIMEQENLFQTTTFPHVFGQPTTNQYKPSPKSPCL